MVKLAVGAEKHLTPAALGQVFVAVVADALIANLVSLTRASFAGTLHSLSIHPNACLRLAPPPEPPPIGGESFGQAEFRRVLLFTLRGEA